MPAIQLQRDRICRELNYSKPIRIGAAGGIGAPEAVVAAFMLGADFILTGSINQCTVESGTSDAVKDILQNLSVQDTEYAPAGDLFELGAKVQVVKKGIFFPVRANKLYEIYQRHNSLEEIDEATRVLIQEKYFKRSFDEVWNETRNYLDKLNPAMRVAAESNPKQKMSLIFRWYFTHSTRLAMSGSDVQKVDYQIHCGPAMGAFNQWVKGSHRENWRNRYVADIAELLMCTAAELLTHRIACMQGQK